MRAQNMLNISNLVGLFTTSEFPDTRIRFPNEVPATSSPRILGMEIVSTDEKGFLKKLH
jgi:hypothetical protein